VVFARCSAGHTGHHDAQVPFAEDQHPVGDLGPGGEHEPFRIGVRARTPRRDLDRFDAGAGQDRVERGGELPGPVADQEPEVRDPVAEVHKEVPDLLGGPRPVRVGGHAGDVHVAGADLHDEQAVQALEGDRAVHVEEVGGEHRGGVRVQELQPCRVGVPLRAGGIFIALSTRPIVEALTLWPSLSSSPWIRWSPQPWFSVASCSISVVSPALTGGRPAPRG
jgi:hypothetical protein